MKPSLSPLEKFLRKSSRQGALIERLASKHAGKQANRQHNERARARDDDNNGSTFWARRRRNRIKERRRRSEEGEGSCCVLCPILYDARVSTPMGSRGKQNGVARASLRRRPVCLCLLVAARSQSEASRAGRQRRRPNEINSNEWIVQLNSIEFGSGGGGGGRVEGGSRSGSAVRKLLPE